MTDRETTRLIAWSKEMRTVHQRLRDALAVTRQTVAAGVGAGAPGERAARDLLLFCHGFCTALGEHHRGEDRVLFPVLAREHPELGEALRALRQDHSMVDHLLGGLQGVVDRGGAPAELDRHLEGIAAIMESHFRYEERQLLRVLETLRLDADVGEVYGSL